MHVPPALAATLVSAVFGAATLAAGTAVAETALHEHGRDAEGVALGVPAQHGVVGRAARGVHDDLVGERRLGEALADEAGAGGGVELLAGRHRVPD